MHFWQSVCPQPMRINGIFSIVLYVVKQFGQFIIFLNKNMHVIFFIAIPISLYFKKAFNYYSLTHVFINLPKDRVIKLLMHKMTNLIIYRSTVFYYF